MNSFWNWLDKQDAQISYVKYLKVEDLDSHKAHFQLNQIKSQMLARQATASNKIPTEIMFVMNDKGEFLVAPKVPAGTPGVDAFHHSSFLGGRPVAAAGFFEVDPSNGTLKGITDRSGHYKGRDVEIFRALHSLRKKGVDLSKVSLDFFSMAETKKLFDISESDQLTAEDWYSLFSSRFEFYVGIF